MSGGRCAPRLERNSLMGFKAMAAACASAMVMAGAASAGSVGYGANFEFDLEFTPLMSVFKKRVLTAGTMRPMVFVLLPANPRAAAWGI